MMISVCVGFQHRTVDSGAGRRISDSTVLGALCRSAVDSETPVAAFQTRIGDKLAVPFRAAFSLTGQNLYTTQIQTATEAVSSQGVLLNGHDSPMVDSLFQVECPGFSKIRRFAPQLIVLVLLTCCSRHLFWATGSSSVISLHGTDQFAPFDAKAVSNADRRATELNFKICTRR